VHPLALLSQFITTTISSLGYGGVVLLMAIESACVPLPSEIILPFAGYLVFTGRFELSMVALAGAVGCNLGSAVAYAVGYYGGRPWAERYGRHLLLSPRELDRAVHWFARYGNATVFFARLLPVIRTFIALPAGIARMPFGRFNLYTFLGSLRWCYALAYAGVKLGEHWESLHGLFHRFDLVIGAALLVAGAWYVRRHVRESRTSELT